MKKPWKRFPKKPKKHPEEYKYQSPSHRAARQQRSAGGDRIRDGAGKLGRTKSMTHAAVRLFEITHGVTHVDDFHPSSRRPASEADAEEVEKE